MYENIEGDESQSCEEWKQQEFYSSLRYWESDIGKGAYILLIELAIPERENAVMGDVSKESQGRTISTTRSNRERVIIMGAAGRDFHNFNVCFRDHPEYEVVAFTAAQIPGIENRRYPPSLSGSLYPDGIPIYPEEKLEALILEDKIQQVIFAYSDVSHVTLMHLASRVLSRGADFRLIGPEHSFRVRCPHRVRKRFGGEPHLDPAAWPRLASRSGAPSDGACGRREAKRA
jgi:hypothetical protein